MSCWSTRKSSTAPAITGAAGCQDDDGQHRRLPGAAADQERADRVATYLFAPAQSGGDGSAARRPTVALTGRSTIPQHRSSASLMRAAATQSLPRPAGGLPVLSGGAVLGVIVAAILVAVGAILWLPPAAAYWITLRGGGPGGGGRGPVRLGALCRRPAGGAGAGRPVPDEHLPAALVVRPELLQLPRQPAGTADLGRARQLCERAGRPGDLAAAADHGPDGDPHRRLADDRGLPAGAAVRAAVSRCAAIC